MDKVTQTMMSEIKKQENEYEKRIEKLTNGDVFIVLFYAIL